MSGTPDEPIDAELLLPAVGAMIFASDEPTTASEIAAALGGAEAAAVDRAVETLSQTLERSALGLRIERVAGGYRMATASEVAPWLRRLFQQRNRSRLSPGALETLAIVAYRQPVTLPEIQAIRGKDPAAALRGLLDKRLIKILGRKKVVGNPLLYGTAREFLVHFGLNSLDDLPPIDGFEALAAELAGAEPRAVEGAAPDAGAAADDDAADGTGEPASV